MKSPVKVTTHREHRGHVAYVRAGKRIVHVSEHAPSPEEARAAARRWCEGVEALKGFGGRRAKDEAAMAEMI